MGDLAKLYQEMKNPLDDPKVIKKILTAYSNRSHGGMYKGLVQTIKKDYAGKYSENASDYFYSMMFNKWKNNIRAMTRAEFVELYQKGEYGLDLIKLREYLLKVDDIKTADEANKIFRTKFDDEELTKAMRKYRWTAFGEGPEWQHVASRYVTAKKDKIPNIEHRLYLDTEPIYTHRTYCIFGRKMQ